MKVQLLGYLLTFEEYIPTKCKITPDLLYFYLCFRHKVLLHSHHYHAKYRFPQFRDSSPLSSNSRSLQHYPPFPVVWETQFYHWILVSFLESFITLLLSNTFSTISISYWCDYVFYSLILWVSVVYLHILLYSGQAWWFSGVSGDPDLYFRSFSGSALRTIHILPGVEVGLSECKASV